jgi:starch synthase
LSDSAAKRETKDAEIRMASRIIVASECTRRSLLRHQATDVPIAVIPYGVAPPRKLEPRMLCPKGQLSVLFLGRIAPRKGVHRLLRVWNQLKLSKASLTLAGIVEIPKAFLDREVDQSNGAVTVTGPLSVSGVEQLLSKTDLLVLPSLAEGFGMVILEAMIRGIPVIGSDATALPEILGPSTCGRVIPAGDSDALSLALTQLSDDRHSLTELGCESREIARQYTWDRYREMLSDTLQSLTRTKI